MSLLKNLLIEHSFTKGLPADSNELNSPRQVENSCFSFVDPLNPKKPVLIHSNPNLLSAFGITDSDSKSFLELMSGAKNFPDFRPYAMCYGGHQFGHWAGQLGDGRAINIAEIETQIGKRFLQLKGAGKTPYSRGADGLAVLRSSIREYLMSEAMFGLGIATTRALALSLTGDEVLRDVLYNGNSAYEKGAVVCRTAASFIRFGSFEIFAARGDHHNLKILADYIIETYFPNLGEPNKDTYLAFFQSVVNNSREMVLNWQRVGFVHGVMNTDNMSILGLTIDYGPYGWLENYDPGWTPNTTDAQHKRYRYGNQPSVVLWNLTQLANALFPLIKDVKALELILDDFKNGFQSDYQNMMLSKLGVFSSMPDDEHLVSLLSQNLRLTETDMTLFFRNLSHFNSNTPESHLKIIEQDSYVKEVDFNKHVFAWRNWLDAYKARLTHEKLNQRERVIKMNTINPKYVLRNYMAHLAIEHAEKGDYSVLNELFDLLQNPYSEQPLLEKWFAKRPAWANNKIGCSMLSCSS